MFDTIVANDVLEQVRDLVAMMTTCLRLLRRGGIFKIKVTYDLSFGAWQDPTHVRTFNDRSWLYYTDWFWDLGWRDARFVVDAMDYVPSPIGVALRDRNVPDEEIARTLRAIDSMLVTLRKIDLTHDDRKALYYWRDRKRLAELTNSNAGREPVAPATPDNVAPVAFSGSWEDNRHRFCIWVVTPDGYDHHHAFDEVAEVLSAAFRALGGSAPIVKSQWEWAGRAPIVLGGHLLAPSAGVDLPRHAILFNFEQVDANSPWVNSAYLSLLKRYAVLDYSIANTQALQASGIGHARHFPIRFMPILARVGTAADCDIDVLFYGSMNERRALILEGLQARGLNVVHLFGVYGAQRDAAIARAKVIVNIHFFAAGIFEAVRVCYLLANGKCVVSEGRPDDPDIADIADGIVVCAFHEIVDRCIELIEDDAKREALARRGRTAIAATTQADILGAAFASSNKADL
jgi:hypothetical protein